MIVVANTTPLIALATISSLDLLHSLFGRVTIPKAVYREVVTEGKGRPGEKEIARAEWIETRAVKDHRAVERLMRTFRLDEGESEVIVLAEQLGAARVILDEQSARRCATRRRLAVIGTVGILLAAKGKQLIPSVREKMDALLAAGFYLDPATYRDVLRKAGES